MRAVSVTVPDGAAWRIRVDWLPRWPALVRRLGGWRRRRNRGRDGDDIPDVSEHATDFADDLVSAVVVFVVAVVFVALAWWVLLPVLLLVLDIVVVVLLLALGTPARVLLRRPWTVLAVGSTGGRHTVAVTGWRHALRVRDELAERLRLGYPAPTAASFE